MATYNFSPDGALDTGAELITVTTKLEDSLSTLQTAVARFQAANQGLTVENYSAAQQLWNQGQAEMNAAMAKGVQALNEISQEYVLADNRGAMVFGQLM